MTEGTVNVPGGGLKRAEYRVEKLTDEWGRRKKGVSCCKKILPFSSPVWTRLLGCPRIKDVGI